VTRLELYDLGLDWLDAFPDRVRAVSAGDLDAAARDLLSPGDYLMVVVGNVDHDDLELDQARWLE